MNLDLEFFQHRWDVLNIAIGVTFLLRTGYNWKGHAYSTTKGSSDERERHSSWSCRTVAWGINIPPTSPGFWMILMVLMTPNNYDDPPFSGSGWSCLAPQTRQDDESSVNTTNMIRQKAENVLIKCMTSCFIEKWRSSSLQFVVKLHGFVF